jgi:uncharacterized protein
MSPGRLVAAGSEFDSKLAFLSGAAHYPEHTSRVDCVETHMSWVFLTDRHAYKLKKPVRNADVDLRTVAARQWNCAEEARLNRRLSTGVYLGTVALRGARGGELTFAEEGEIVDWLVKMRRLPADCMLDRRIRLGSIPRADVDALMTRLCDFYRRCAPIGVLAPEYRRQFREDVIANQLELFRPVHVLPRELIERVCAGQLATLDDRSALFDARVHAGRIVEGHGDLRPEHICFEVEPQIIDCLEFSRVLRTLDIVDELGFLALECERLGAPELRPQIFDSYRERSGDAPPDALVHFYQSHRACVRATLAIRHLHEPALPNAFAWRARAREYLELAYRHVEQSH